MATKQRTRSRPSSARQGDRGRGERTIAAATLAVQARAIAHEGSSNRCWRPPPWQASPLFWPLLEAARAFETEPDWPPVDRYRGLLGERCPVDFHLAPPRGRGRARSERRTARPSYDATICEVGSVPTRARSWHDLFNALVWAAFPRTKTALHRRQHRAQASAADAGRRTREQDALALLDEGGVALLCQDSCWSEASAALAARDAERVAALRATASVLGVVYGHAVYEHLGCGGPPVRAMVHLVPCPTLPREPEACRAMADEALAKALADPAAFTNPDLLRSLPVRPEILGVHT